MTNSAGVSWTADYLKITGELDVDLRSNVAAEARAKIVYDRLLHYTDDAGTKDALQFLMTREIAHMKAFLLALESMGKDPLSIGEIPPTPDLARKYFNDSTGRDDGSGDFRGPWNEGGDSKFELSGLRAPPRGGVAPVIRWRTVLGSVSKGYSPRGEQPDSTAIRAPGRGTVPF